MLTKDWFLKHLLIYFFTMKYGFYINIAFPQELRAIGKCLGFYIKKKLHMFQSSANSFSCSQPPFLLSFGNQKLKTVAKCLQYNQNQMISLSHSSLAKQSHTPKIYSLEKKKITISNPLLLLLTSLTEEKKHCTPITEQQCWQ